MLQRRPGKFALHNGLRALSTSAVSRAITPEASFASIASPVTPLTVLSEEEQAFKETVQKMSKEKIEPLVKKMDEASHMDRSVIDALFENGVSCLP